MRTAAAEDGARERTFGGASGSERRLDAPPRVVEPQTHSDVEFSSATTFENRELHFPVNAEMAAHRVLMPIALWAQRAKLFAFRRIQQNAKCSLGAAGRALLRQRPIPLPTSPRSALQRRVLSARRIASVLNKACLARFGNAWRRFGEFVEFTRTEQAVLLSLSSSAAHLSLREELFAAFPQLFNGADTDSDIWQPAGKCDQDGASQASTAAQERLRDERRMTSPLELFAPR
jgi:hypothetical protein